MDKVGRSPRSNPYANKDVGTYNDAREQGRDISRRLGLDPGNSPDVRERDDGFYDAGSPALAEMTTDRGEHPVIGPVGTPRMPKHSPRTVNGEARR